MSASSHLQQRGRGNRYRSLDLETRVAGFRAFRTLRTACGLGFSVRAVSNFGSSGVGGFEGGAGGGLLVKLRECVCVCVSLRVCVCVSVCALYHQSTYILYHQSTYIPAVLFFYLSIYLLRSLPVYVIPTVSARALPKQLPWSRCQNISQIKTA